MASLKQSGRFVLPDATLAAIREEFDAGRADETETAPRSAPPGARPAISSIPIPRWRWRWPIATPRIRGFPTSCCRPRMPAKFPDAVEAACGVRPQLPAWLEGLMTKSEHIKVMKNDQAEVERFVLSVSRAAKQGVAG